MLRVYGACFVLFLFCLPICVCFHFQVQGPLRECRSIMIRSGFCGLPSYCAPLVCVPDISGVLAVWRHNKPKTNKKQKQFLSQKKKWFSATRRLLAENKWEKNYRPRLYASFYSCNNHYHAFFINHSNKIFLSSSLWNIFSSLLTILTPPLSLTGRLPATLLLRPTRMCSQPFGGISSCCCCCLFINSTQPPSLECIETMKGTA